MGSSAIAAWQINKVILLRGDVGEKPHISEVLSLGDSREGSKSSRRV